MVKYFFLSIVLSLFFISCSDIKKNVRIEKITNMQKGLDSMENVIKSSKIDTLTKMVLAAQDVEFRIRNNYKLDTINLEFGKRIDSYKRMRKAIPKLSSNWKKVEKSIGEMRNSLKNLKLDIENNSGKREKYDSYINFEQNKFNQIKILMKECLSGQKKIIDTYITLHPELYAFSISLIKK